MTLVVCKHSEAFWDFTTYLLEANKIWCSRLFFLASQKSCLPSVQKEGNLFITITIMFFSSSSNCTVVKSVWLWEAGQQNITTYLACIKYIYLLFFKSLPLQQSFFCKSLSQSVNCGSWDTTTQVNTPFLIFLCVCSHSAAIKKLNWETGPVFTTLHSRIHVSSSVDDDEYLQQTLFLWPFFTKLSSFSLLSLLTKLIYVTKGRLSLIITYKILVRNFRGKRVELVHIFPELNKSSHGGNVKLFKLTRWLILSLSLLTNQDENKQQLFCVLSINFEPIY